MFKNILQFWKGKDFLKQVLEEFESMLEKAEKMFQLVCQNLIEHKAMPDLEKRIYDLDRNVNEQERDIRRRIVEHLAIQPSVDVPVSLLLMSVVKDAERLGDYAKNLFEVNRIMEKPIDDKLYSEFFGKLHENIGNLFVMTKQAFLESDEAKAKDTWNVERGIVKNCDDIINKLAKSSISVNEAVGFTLMARHFKRIGAHLTNIATSVVLPVDNLDYFDEKRKEQETDIPAQ